MYPEDLTTSRPDRGRSTFHQESVSRKTTKMSNKITSLYSNTANVAALMPSQQMFISLTGWNDKGTGHQLYKG